MSEKQKAEFRKEKIGFVFQDFNLMDFLDVKENIILGLRLNKINIKDKEKDIQEIVDELDIKDILDKYPFECSGGTKTKNCDCKSFWLNNLVSFFVMSQQEIWIVIVLSN